MLKKSSEKPTPTNVDTDRLQMLASIVSERFGLNGYALVKFNDKGKTVDIALENRDFTVSVNIHDVDDLLGTYDGNDE